MSERLPAFAWEEWYTAVGGRTIRIEEVADYLRQIYDDQYTRFVGEVAPVRREFASPQEAARHIKDKATEFGAAAVTNNDGFDASVNEPINRGKDRQA